MKHLKCASCSREIIVDDNYTKICKICHKEICLSRFLYEIETCIDCKFKNKIES